MLLAFCLASALPLRAWVGIAYYGGFGVVVSLLPWLETRLQSVEQRSLQARLAFGLALCSVLPLVIAVTLLDEVLAGNTGHGVTIEAVRDISFLVLMVFTVIAIVAGIGIARWLAAPLQAIARAASRLSYGDAAEPLPASSVPEIARLAVSFGEMRHRLVAQAGERERLLEELQTQNEELQAQSEEIQSQGEELLSQNERLRFANEALVVGQRALSQSEGRFRAVFENAPVGISIIRGGVTMLTNEACVQMFGHGDVSELAGSSSLNRIAPSARDEVAERMRRREQGEELASGYEIVGQRKDGTQFPLYVVTARMELPDGPAIVAFFRDITDNKLAEEALRQSHDELESRVEERTADLARTVDLLRLEIGERERAQEQVQRQIAQLGALRAIDDAIKASLDINVTAMIILEQVIARLGVDAADLLLFNPRTQVLEFLAERGFRKNAITGSRVEVGQGLAGRVMLERRTVKVPSLAEVGRQFTRASLVEGEDFIAYCGVPLVAKGQVKGILEIFHRAPLDPDPEWLNFMEIVAGQAAIAIDNASLFDELQRANLDLTIAYDRTIEGWSRALDLRDKETEGHSQRVTETTLRLAREMGMSDSTLLHLRRGALLHDIGKVGVPDSVLWKPGPLSHDERAVIEKHPLYAYELLWPISYLRPAIDIPYCHHEKWDGTGYPRGLRGEAIPPEARIFAVVDVWDALLSERPYRPAWPADRVREHIASLSGSHFWPEAVEAFIKLEP